ncbi:epoxyqueuosine reductase QueH [Thermodesulfovibrio sp.]|jgi:predicted adenine nucleotide alpha hydrolase (AANH) superfamily ATPase|uniref:epoxyqueuosine reductase QueH n=1 Tax=Thermodesulfovibrio TaxID=28261 RepID=UPI002617A0FA|nr:epoxyqueuosine reductase QueH [Thermodesulfovibrio sp.]
MKILIHTCCSNCALYPVEILQKRGFEIVLYWHNPNIHPYSEYKNRLESVNKLENLMKLTVVYDQDYREFYKFLRMVMGKEKERCQICYQLRLERTAKKSKELNIELFTTTLLVSPYQKFDKILKIGKELAFKYGISFLTEDFREGFKKGMNKARELELFRQKYCGCIYSEAERYLRQIEYE